MSYTRVGWTDRSVAQPNRYTMVDNGDGTVTLTPSPGTILSEGTVLSAANLNHMEDGIIAAQGSGAASGQTISAVSVTVLTTGWQYSTDKKNWTDVTLPHTCNASDASSSSMFRGVRWYKRDLVVARDNDQLQYIIRFSAAGQHTTVEINRVQIAEFAGGYVPFEADVSDYIHAGANEILVCCDNSFDIDIIPLSWDYNSENGLYRGIELLTQDALALDACAYGIDRLHVLQSNVSAASATLTVKTRVTNRSASAKDGVVACSLLDADNTVVATGSYTASVSSGSYANVSIPIQVANPHLWNGMSDPHLYKMRITLSLDNGIIDTAECVVGIRYFNMSRTAGFSLNGSLLKLRGVAMHQDSYAHAQAATQADVNADYTIIDDLGCNFLRLAHYPHSFEAINACDTRGIIVQTEIPWVNHCGVNASTTYFANIKANMASFIRNYYNHPSILFWGMWNEMNGSHYKATPTSDYSDPQGGYDVSKCSSWTTELYTYAKGLLEDSRFVGVNMHDSSTQTIAQKNWSADYVAFNRYDGWYSSDEFTAFGTKMDAKHTADTVHPMAVGEYGAGANPATHSDTPLTTTNKYSGGARHDEEFQNLFHESYAEQIIARDWLAFTSVWVLFDFAVSGRNEGGTPYVNDKGIVTRDRATMKDAYYLYKSLWRTDIPVVYITSRRFTSRTTQTIQVKVYSNAESLTLSVDNTDVQTMSSPTRCGVIWEFDALALSTGTHTIAVRGAKNSISTSDSVSWISNYANTVSFATQPQSSTVLAGNISGNLTVSATATDASAISYQWYSNTSNSSSGGTVITGETSASMAIPTSLTAGTYYYYCIATSETAGSASSSCATITVSDTASVTITTQPQSASVTAGSVSGSLNIAAAATDDSSLTYQWYQSTTLGGTGTAVSGKTQATMTLDTQLAAGTYYYYCVATSTTAGSATSDTATITVSSAPVVAAITTQPSNASGAIGDSVSFSVVAVGDGITYQWYFSNDSGSTWVISGNITAQTATLTKTIADTDNGQQWRCIITDQYNNSATSNAAAISIPVGDYLAFYTLSGTAGGTIPSTIADDSGNGNTLTVAGSMGTYGDNGYMTIDAEGDTIRAATLSLGDATSVVVHVKAYSTAFTVRSRYVTLGGLLQFMFDKCTGDSAYNLRVEDSSGIVYQPADRIGGSSNSQAYSASFRYVTLNITVTDTSVSVEETVTFVSNPTVTETHAFSYTGLLTAIKNSGIIIGNRVDGLRPLLGEPREVWIE